MSETQYLVGGARIVKKNEGIGEGELHPDDRVTVALTDLIGTTSAVIDLVSGALVETSTYYPNGARETYRAPDSENVAAEPYGFTGKEADEEVGLTYFGERYLISRIGRWASPDPLSIHAAGGGEALNAFHYVSGNLLQARDPLGLDANQSVDPSDGGNQSVPANSSGTEGTVGDASPNLPTPQEMESAYTAGVKDGASDVVIGAVVAVAAVMVGAAAGGTGGALAAGALSIPGDTASEAGSPQYEDTPAGAHAAGYEQGAFVASLGLAGAAIVRGVAGVIRKPAAPRGPPPQGRRVDASAGSESLDAPRMVEHPSPAAAPSNAHPTFQPGPHAGESIPARSTSQRFTGPERAEMNRIGEATGCHTCGTTNPGTKSGNFVPDHQPPSALASEGTAQQLYPQCINCSREQGLAIARERRGQ